MSVSVTMNGTTYTIPSTGDTNWGAQVTTWIQATSSSTLQKNGGSFVLTAEVDFGATWGIKVAYLKSKSTNSAGSGVIRLSNTDAIAFRNVANTNDISLIPDAVTDGILNYNSVPLVGTTLTQTLTNKTLSSPVINTPTGITKSDVGLSNVDNTSDATKNAAVATLTNKTLTAPVINSPTGIVKGDVGLGNVDNTSDATKNAAAATLTNKTIDADLNTITNIDNTDIKAAAAIARTKLASGTVSHVLINDGSGVMSSEAQLAISRGGTGQTTASASFDALSPLTTKGDLIVRNASTNTRLPIGSDGQVLVGDSTQSLGVKWTSLQQGTKNYLTYNNFENNATTGWNKFNTTLTGVNPTGTVTLTAASITTFATTATNPLAGVYSLNVASSAAWSAGQGIISDAYSIDREDLATVMRFNFFTEIVSGLSNLSLTGTTTNTFAVWFYDVTNSAWIQPSSCYGLTGTGKVSGEVQLPSTCLSFRLAILCANASAGAVSLNFDDFSFGPQQTVRGPTITDPVAITPTFTGFGTVSGVECSTFRVGGNLRGRIKFVTGTTTGVTAQVSIGWNGISGNVTTASSISATGQVVGKGNIDTAAGTFFGGLTLIATPNVSYLTFGVESSTTNGITSALGNAIGSSGKTIEMYFEVPIQGWSSNTLLSSDQSGRIVTARMAKSGTQSLPAGATTKITGFTVIDDKTGMCDTTNSRFNILEPGGYELKFENWISTAAVSHTQAYKVNGGTATWMSSDAVQNRNLGSAFIPNLKVNDYVEVFIFVGSGTNTLAAGDNDTYVSLTKVQGPVQIAAIESISTSYSSTAGQSITTSFTTFVAATKSWDSHGSYNTSTGEWIFSAPGEYSFDGFFRQASLASTIGFSTAFALHVNGSLVKYVGVGRRHTSSSISLEIPVHGKIKVLAGQVVTLKMVSDAAGTLDTTAGFNWIEANRVGNY